jgi:ParB family chromosome partitioning protein
MNEVMNGIQKKIEYLPLIDLHADHEFNSRGPISSIDIVDLIKSIADNGLLQPISVYPYNDTEKVKYGKKYKIVLGYCRFQACMTLKYETIPCVIQPWMPEDRARVLNLTENIKRKDLNILQEANSIAKLKMCGWTQQMVADSLGVSQSWVQNRFAVLSFPADIQRECAIGTLNQIQIKEIYSLPLKEQYEAVRAIKDARLKGERNIKVKKPVKANIKVVRSRGGINKMLDLIYDELGPSFATRCLAWSAGNISSLDLFTDIKNQKLARGEGFLIPEDEFL